MQTRRARRRAPIAGLPPWLREKIRRVPHLRVVVEDGRARLVRPGERFAVVRAGDAYEGTWVPEGDELPAGASDLFTEAEARIALALLRDDTRPGRPPKAPTTDDGRLVERACRELGVKGAGLAVLVGSHKAVLSRARHGVLPASTRRRILELLAKAHRS